MCQCKLKDMHLGWMQIEYLPFSAYSGDHIHCTHCQADCVLWKCVMILLGRDVTQNLFFPFPFLSAMHKYSGKSNGHSLGWLKSPYCEIMPSPDKKPGYYLREIIKLDLPMLNNLTLSKSGSMTGPYPVQSIVSIVYLQRSHQPVDEPLARGKWYEAEVCNSRP